MSAAPPAAAKLWGGRFTGATDPLMEAFNNSFPFDKRMWRQDIAGSVAYAHALARAGILTGAEAAELARGLRAVEAEWAAGAFVAHDGDEDIHTANERRLGELIGPLAGKLHTGRRCAIAGGRGGGGGAAAGGGGGAVGMLARTALTHRTRFLRPPPPPLPAVMTRWRRTCGYGCATSCARCARTS